MKLRRIDPRIKLILLPTAGFISFFINDTFLLLIIVLFGFLLYLYSRLYKGGIVFLIVFSLFVLAEFGLESLKEQSFIFGFYMLIYFFSRMTVIVMFGTYIVKTTGISEMVEGFNKMRIPRSISIPFSVLLRFSPTMKYEIRALKENMKVRAVINSRFFLFLHPVKYLEYAFVPLLMRAIKVSDELSASALIRGLDSTEKRVTLTTLRIGKMDWLVMILGVLTMFLVIILEKVV